MLFGAVGCILMLVYLANYNQPKGLLIAGIVCAILGLIWNFIADGAKNKEE